MTATEMIARGIAAGESLSFSNADFRLQYMAPRRVRRTRMLNLKSDELHLTNVARPYVHSNPPENLHPGPGENLEWFVFSALNHQRVKAGRQVGETVGWAELSARDPLTLRSRLGTRIALKNLSNGLRPPQSGHDNPHYFDDIAMTRALAAVAVYEGEPIDVVRSAARSDASVTHSLDGVWCAEAVSVLFQGLLEGDDVSNAVAASIAVLPKETWSHRVAVTSVECVERTSGAIERGRKLSIEVGDWLYSYPVGAPETLGFLLAHVLKAGSPEDLLLGALQGRNAYTLPALAGAAAAVRFGTGWIPTDVRAQELRLTGLCIPEYANRPAMDLIGS